MKYYAKTLAVAVALVAAAPAFANSQLIASAGLTPAEAAGLSLTEIAQVKFNREAGTQDQQAVSDRVSPAVAANRPLNAMAVASANAGVSFSDQQLAVPHTGATKATRSASGGGAWSQLIASAGLTPEEAAGMTLNEIAIAKFNNDADRDNRQGAY